MAYTVGQIKLLAYNCEERDDFTIPEFNLFCGLAYAYEWYRANPEDKDECQKMMENYINFFVNVKNEAIYSTERPSWLDRKRAESAERM